MSDSPANTLVVILDSARAKSIGPSALLRAPTPQIEELARHGTEFRRAIAPGNWTVPSHMSIFTGVYPWTHGRRTFEVRPVREQTIASWLAQRGVETALFSEEVHLVAGYGLEGGYGLRYCPVPAMSDRDRTVTNRLFGSSRWLYSSAVRGMMRRLPLSSLPLTFPNFRAEIAFKREVCNRKVIDAFDGWLRERQGRRPFHAFVNFVDPHEPYYPQPVDGARTPVARAYAGVPRYYLLTVPRLRERVPWGALEAWYCAAIGEADAKVGALLESLGRHGVLDRTWVIVSSDHGQSFGEGGNIYHGCGATDSVTRVPLVVRPPDGIQVPSRVDRWSSLCEVPSWIKAIALGRAPYDDHGFPTVPFPLDPPSNTVVYCEGGPASDPNLSLEGAGPGERWNHRLIAAYVGQEKYILDTVAGDVRRWSGGEDPDGRAPERLDVDARRRALTEVFGLAGEEDIARRRGEGGARLRAPLEDSRMRSWGYD
ncbi:MAG: sulfatase [Thermoplasmata archaeon]|nr:sulfatase [Thermoplasmata archaeon]